MTRVGGASVLGSVATLAFLSLGGFPWFSMDITTGFFGIFLLACAYSAQYWAKQCRDELREIKEELKKGR